MPGITGSAGEKHVARKPVIILHNPDFIKIRQIFLLLCIFLAHLSRSLIGELIV